MASPQRENGHLDLANELVEMLAKTKLSGSEWQIIFVVFRKTWAWNKKTDWISLNQLEKLTGLSRVIICRAKKRLVNKNILLQTKNGLSFNKNYEGWVVNKNTPLVNKKAMGSKQKGNLGSKQKYTHNTFNSLQKKLLQKKEVIPLSKQIEPFTGQYAPNMLTDFTLYWDEKDDKGRARWQKEKTWEIEKRLQKWRRNQEKWEREREERFKLKQVNEKPTHRNDGEVRENKGFEKLF